MTDDAALLELYDASSRSYATYVKVARGDSKDLTTRKAEALWHEAHAALVLAGGTPEVVQRLLRARVGSSKTKRKVGR